MEQLGLLGSSEQLYIPPSPANQPNTTPEARPERVLYNTLEDQACAHCSEKSGGLFASIHATPSPKYTSKYVVRESIMLSLKDTVALLRIWKDGRNGQTDHLHGQINWPESRRGYFDPQFYRRKISLELQPHRDPEAFWLVRTGASAVWYSFISPWILLAT